MTARPTTNPPSPPAPDAKDWTWVVERPCHDCGFDASSIAPTDVAARIRATAAEWEAILAEDEDIVMARPRPAVWSAAEYAAHVRDVFALYDQRLALMRSQDDPLYANWDQDATAVEERYDLQTPSQILPDLLANAASLADQFDLVQGEQWQRTGRRSDGAQFTIATFAQYLIHDPVHHVQDALAGMVAVRVRR